MKPNVTLGILAHVDAGKTTLSESLLYLAGKIKKPGRVDHKDTFLDTYELERSRGITIFSKQAIFDYSDIRFNLLDTPGHADFSPEMERTLQVLDIATLIISAPDGVTSQAKMLFKLLEHYHVPTVIFVNKMDQPGTDIDAVTSAIRETLGSSCISFDENVPEDEFYEELAMCDEELLTRFLDGKKITSENINNLIHNRKCFPILFGSALKTDGVQKLLDLICRVAPSKSAEAENADGTQKEFGARIYKISRDSSGNRLTHIKITSGVLNVRDSIQGEKVDQIRLYSGDKFEQTKSAHAGMVCAVTGLSGTRAGEGLGILEGSNVSEVLQPILSCTLILPEDVNPVPVFKHLKILEEEEPMLQVTSLEETGQIEIQIMGEVQKEILRHMLKTRFDIDAEFGPGHTVYKETIANSVEGIGHFEPLRHYAEVHLLLEPGEPGSGLVFSSDCATDDLALNWQRLVLTHLGEKKHRGVLTGSEITDMKITLIAGKAHEKHTEGGDFRQATYRAVRQGLMQADSVLLEPILDYRIELPQDAVGRALTDIQMMNGTVGLPDIEGDRSVLTGTVPAACLGNYAQELSAYTKGEGHIFTTLSGYGPCHNAEEIIASSGYDPDLDADNPSSSVFCMHGAATLISWDEVPNYMHLDARKTNLVNRETITDLTEDLNIETLKKINSKKNAEDTRSFAERQKDYFATEDELKSIFERTYGTIKPRYTDDRSVLAPSDDIEAESNRDLNIEQEKRDKHRNATAAERAALEASRHYLLVDGYNVIHASKELKELAMHDLKAARDSLIDTLSNFQGYRREEVLLIFDAYKVPGGKEHIEKLNNLTVIYTKEAETADQYIEKAAHEFSKKYRVTVATSDAIEQVIVFSAGAIRMSASEFWEEVAITRQSILDKISEKKHK
ncbi:MAG: TetM/TetW/TetO/TetS family tetracycline resistance ribosomal protection protein [Butyrivibrio sp.]|nr:TetM/TetW/TetO/TetS family tetracycline resistance ribosomal protection protein [Butyrivibrio sp.]